MLAELASGSVCATTTCLTVDVRKVCKPALARTLCALWLYADDAISNRVPQIGAVIGAAEAVFRCRHTGATPGRCHSADDRDSAAWRRHRGSHPCRPLVPSPCHRCRRPCRSRIPARAASGAWCLTRSVTSIAQELYKYARYQTRLLYKSRYRGRNFLVRSGLTDCGIVPPLRCLATTCLGTHWRRLKSSSVLGQACGVSRQNGVLIGGALSGDLGFSRHVFSTWHALS